MKKFKIPTRDEWKTMSFRYRARVLLRETRSFWVPLAVIVVLLWLLLAFAELLGDGFHTSSGAQIFAQLCRAGYIAGMAFTTIGFGDVAPQTHAGRAICIMLGLCGTLFTGFTVWMLTKLFDLQIEDV